VLDILASVLLMSSLSMSNEMSGIGLRARWLMEWMGWWLMESSGIYMECVADGDWDGVTPDTVEIAR
jgi:hypothetical protein